MGSCKLSVFVQDGEVTDHVTDCSLPMANFAKSMETLIGSLIKDDTTGTMLQIRTRIFQSCDVKRRVDWYRIPKSSEACTVPFFSVFGDFLDFSEDGGETVTFRRSVLPPRSGCSLTTLKMETTRSSEMLAPLYHSRRHYVASNMNLHHHCPEKLMPPTELHIRSLTTLNTII
jgi:hypothetical protein